MVRGMAVDYRLGNFPCKAAASGRVVKRGLGPSGIIVGSSHRSAIVESRGQWSRMRAGAASGRGFTKWFCARWGFVERMESRGRWLRREARMVSGGDNRCFVASQRNHVKPRPLVAYARRRGHWPRLYKMVLLGVAICGTHAKPRPLVAHAPARPLAAALQNGSARGGDLWNACKAAASGRECAPARPMAAALQNGSARGGDLWNASKAATIGRVRAPARPMVAALQSRLCDFNGNPPTPFLPFATGSSYGSCFVGFPICFGDGCFGAFFTTQGGMGVDPFAGVDLGDGAVGD
jgi:hypothetical protein